MDSGYNAKKQKMYLESQVRKRHIEIACNILWYFVVILASIVYVLARCYIITQLTLFLLPLPYLDIRLVSILDMSGGTREVLHE